MVGAATGSPSTVRPLERIIATGTKGRHELDVRDFAIVGCDALRPARLSAAIYGTQRARLGGVVGCD